MPKIAVLLATYNGMRWLEEQMSSILNQKRIDVGVFVSDDHSTDGTYEWLLALAERDGRIIVLPRAERFGSAAKNFYRLITEVETQGFDYFALADQDDVWLDNKLIKLVGIAREKEVDGVSSSVIAYWADNSRALVDKARPLRTLDFLFESAGPGCTFVMTPWLIDKVRSVLHADRDLVSEIQAHDWLIYAVCRSAGRGWYICQTPTVRYRQHGKNELGANIGLKAKMFRLGKIASGWYRHEVQKIAMVSLSLSSDSLVQNACRVLLKNRLFTRVEVLRLVRYARRTREDRCILALSVLLFLV